MGPRTGTSPQCRIHQTGKDLPADHVQHCVVKQCEVVGDPQGGSGSRSSGLRSDSLAPSTLT